MQPVWRRSIGVGLVYWLRTLDEELGVTAGPMHRTNQGERVREEAEEISLQEQLVVMAVVSVAA